MKFRIYGRRKIRLLQPDEVRAVFDDDCLRHVSTWVNGGVDIGRTKDVTAIVLAEQLQVEAEKLVFVRSSRLDRRQASKNTRQHQNRSKFKPRKMDRAELFRSPAERRFTFLDIVPIAFKLLFLKDIAIP